MPKLELWTLAKPSPNLPLLPPLLLLLVYRIRREHCLPILSLLLVDGMMDMVEGVVVEVDFEAAFNHVAVVVEIIVVMVVVDSEAERKTKGSLPLILINIADTARLLVMIFMFVGSMLESKRRRRALANLVMPEETTATVLVMAILEVALHSINRAMLLPLIATPLILLTSLST
jgi:hypothetical protein